VWWGNLRGKRNFGRPSLRWEDNIKIDLQELRYGGVDWIDLAQDRDRRRALVNAVINFRVHKIRGISCLTENRLASQEGLLSSME